MSESKNVKIDVEYLTRVEGHGNIVVNVKDGRVEECRLEIIESPRFFEGMLRGRSIFEAQHITSRICGICACGHSLASLQAAEDALGVVPTQQTILLRKLLLYQEILDSHILHIYLLVAPDLLGVKSFVPLIDTHNELVRRALRMKKNCNTICDILVGRHVHPISMVVGGFTKLPRSEDINTMLEILKGLVPDMEATIELLSTLRFPEFSRPTAYVALANDTEEYPLLDGRIRTSENLLLDKKDYRELTNEFIVPHSSAKHTQNKQESYMVGALARFNLNYRKLHPQAKKAAEFLKIGPICTNPYLNTVAQAVESVHCLQESIAILEYFKEHGVNQEEAIVVGLNERSVIPVKAGNGVGAVEVPRGVLFHNYEIDDTGKIVNANCVIPTGQNLNNIEKDMQKLVPEIIDRNEEEITLLLNMLVRAYDPCISCSTHFLDVKFINR